MRPGFSVTSKVPSGSGSTAHGLTRPVASTVTFTAALRGAAQARVWPAKAGRWDGALAALVSSGWQFEGEVCDEAAAQAIRSDGASTRRKAFVFMGTPNSCCASKEQIWLPIAQFMRSNLFIVLVAVQKLCDSRPRSV
jgi:hypothetical protein